MGTRSSWGSSNCFDPAVLKFSLNFSSGKSFCQSPSVVEEHACQEDADNCHFHCEQCCWRPLLGKQRQVRSIGSGDESLAPRNCALDEACGVLIGAMVSCGFRCFQHLSKLEALRIFPEQVCGKENLLDDDVPSPEVFLFDIDEYLHRVFCRRIGCASLDFDCIAAWL